MSYGYEYGGPHGYYPPPPRSQQGYPVYPAPSYAANDPNNPYAPSHGEAAAQSYDYNRNIIPGLGLNLHHQSNPPHNTAFMPSTVYAPGPSVPGVQPWQQSGGHNVDQSAVFAPAPTRDDGPEERELSDGEMGDIYEPTHTGDSGEAGAGNGRNEADHSAPEVDLYNGGASNAYPSGRDRSGSYSPYLSPNELHQYQSGDDSAIEPQSFNATPADPSQTAHSAPTVSEAKKRAQEAISHMWPLNVRFSHYIEEGIDSTVLGDLFKELGLEIASSGIAFEASPVKAPTAVPPPHRRPSEAAQPPVEPATKGAAKAETVVTQPVKDKSEERKDRIARLLAAKGSSSKGTPPAPTKSTPTSPPPVSKPSPAMKSQAEKSILLQQKMEALERSREKLALERARQEALEVQPEEPAPAGAGPDTHIPSVEPSAQVTSTEEGALPETETGVTIPGLFLSASKSPQLAKTLSKRPVASDFDDTASAPFKRPFGQTRDSRPFLIHVSDDEDDEEMEIDSTGQRSPSAHRVNSPPRRTSSFRDHPGLSNQVPSRQLSSPGMNNVQTPPTAGISGRLGLEDMTKKIEEMKRKIAEAEARKKAKPSQDSSPAPLPLNGSLQDMPMETEGSTDAFIAPAQSPSIARALTDTPGEQVGLEAISQKLPKPSEMRNSNRDSARRGRSRAASERLPLVEAHRREQLLRLQVLQAQVARIEMEIAEDLKEESRLREEAEDSSGSDQEQSRPAQRVSPLPVQPLQVEPVEAAIDSSADNDVDMEQSPPGDQAPGLPLNTADVIISTEQGDSTDIVANVSPNDVPGPLKSVGESVHEAAVELGDTADASEFAGASESGSVSESGDASEPADTSEIYEPSERGMPIAEREPSHASKAFTPEPRAEDFVPDVSDDVPDAIGEMSPTSQQIATVQRESTLESGREEQQTQEEPASSAYRSTFTPYETPLQYFRAFRFHPQFNELVGGGLRSLTYSNKIDMRTPMCPDQVAGKKCPRGAQCDWQHFENIQLQDDQILLQLGDSANLEADQKAEFINGLRQLLTEFRDQKVKDFKTISEGIIKYRARFNRDETKVLPLGNIAL